MPKVSKKEMLILETWGRETFGAEWDKLTERQKTLFVTDFFYIHYKNNVYGKKGK